MKVIEYLTISINFACDWGIFKIFLSDDDDDDEDGSSDHDDDDY